MTTTTTAARTAKNTIGLYWQNNNCASASRLFIHLFAVTCCTTTTWKCLISRFVGNVNSGQRLPFYFSELWDSPLEFNARKICQHLTNWTRCNKRDKTLQQNELTFLSDVFVAVVVVFAYTRYYGRWSLTRIEPQGHLQRRGPGTNYGR